MSGTISFQKINITGTKDVQMSAVHKDKKKPPSPIVITPRGPPKPEDFPQALTLDLPPHERKSDLAAFLCRVKLPQLISITESFMVRNRPVAHGHFRRGETFLLHFITDNPTVHATTSGGNDVRLPVHAGQKYEILPLDPRFDDKEYNGTEELLEASPLPPAVRVVEAFYSDEDSEDQVVGDIIEIKGIERDPERGKLLVGTCGSAQIRYSKAMNSTFTTMLFPEHHRMAELKDHRFPQRVRLPDDSEDLSPQRLKPKQVFQLRKLSHDKHVVATRPNDPTIYSIPVTTPIKFTHEPLTDSQKHILDMLPVMYPLVNTSWGLVDPTQMELPKSMRTAPEVLKLVQAAYMASVKEHWATEDEPLLSGLNTTAAAISPDPPPVFSHIPERPRQSSDGAPRLPPRPPGGLSPVCSDSRSSFGIDADSDSDDYETVPIPSDSILEGISKEAMIAVRDILTKKEKELKKQEATSNAWKTKCKNLEYEVSKLKSTLASTSRSDSKPKLPPSRQGSHQHNLIGTYYTDTDAYDYQIPPPLPPVRSPSALPPPTASRNQLRDRSVQEVGKFLMQHGLGKYVDTFRENGVNGALLVAMEETHMIELQMTRLHALKLTIEVEKMCGPSSVC
ncbi:uncharacterized protein LOC129256594 [Lytechinus pictus]|uniref:uncharacterized protein LOC129256594 n=1 Tax=Lytechinus pictus TaxID=7653 RepID=UPI0030B9FA60